MAVDSYMCPTCGSEVQVGSPCPGCAPKPKRRRKKVAAGRRKAWEQEASSDGLDIPEEPFDYEEFVQREFGTKSRPHRSVKWYWWATAAGLAVLLAWAVVAGLF